MGALASWRDVALIVLSLEAILFGLIPLVGLFFAIQGLRRAEERVRRYARAAREHWRHVHERVVWWADHIRYPFRLRDTRTSLGEEGQR